MLTSDNAKQYSVGSIGERFDRDSFDRVNGSMLITDADAIKAVEDGTCQQVSMGYRCDLVFEPGEYNGEKYDAIQTNIKYNHAAIVETGRAGDDIKIRLDQNDAILVSDHNDQPIHRRNDSMDLEKKVAQLELEVKERDKKLDSLTADMESTKKQLAEAEAKRDAAQEKLDGLEAKQSERKDAEEFKAAVKARVELERQASKVLDEDKLDGLSEIEIRKAVISKLAPKADLEGKDENYIRVRYDVAMESEQSDREGLEKVRKDTSAAKATTPAKDDYRKERQAKLDAMFKGV
jgi:hypothetical protein